MTALIVIGVILFFIVFIILPLSIKIVREFQRLVVFRLGRMIGPKMHITAPYLEGRGSFTPVMHELTGPDDARRMVNYWADAGATSFKAYMNITRDELRGS